MTAKQYLPSEFILNTDPLELANLILKNGPSCVTSACVRFDEDNCYDIYDVVLPEKIDEIYVLVKLIEQKTMEGKKGCVKEILCKIISDGMWLEYTTAEYLDHWVQTTSFPVSNFAGMCVTDLRFSNGLVVTIELDGEPSAPESL